MTIEVVSKQPRAVDFTINGAPLFIRKMPLRLGLKLQQGMTDDGGLPAELVAEAIQQCTLLEGGAPAFESVDTVLDMDTGSMLQLFSEVSAIAFADAEKN